MMVIATENAPPRLRGTLSLWLVEVRNGLYVGAYGRRARERLWDQTREFVGDGSAVMAWSSPNEFGFRIDAIGHDRRDMVDIDGMSLARLRR